MWTRARLKTEAKRILSINYWLPLAVTLVAGIFGANGGGGSSAAGSNAGSSAVQYYKSGADSINDFGAYYVEQFKGLFDNALAVATVVTVVIVTLVIGFAVGFAVRAFLSCPVEVGENRFFMENRSFPSRFARLFWAFGNGNYMNTVKTMFMRELKIFLWSLLFVIPGIIKSYEYTMVPYILAENPQISTARAFELSKKMTDGEKWNIFVLDLSFIGWYLLGTLCCGIGVIFVNPYLHATHAELYQVMREKAFGMSFSDPSELPGFLPQQA